MTRSTSYKYLPLGATFEDYRRTREAKADMIVRVLEHHLGGLARKSMLDIGCNDGSLKAPAAWARNCLKPLRL